MPGGAPARGAPAGVPSGFPPSAPGGGAYHAPVNEAALRTKLATIVTQNGLQALYPPPAFDAVMARLMRVDWAALAAHWRLSMELVVDFAALALYDVVIFCDDSGSMAFEEGGERIDDLKMIVTRVAEVASLFDEDGISVRFINSDVEGNGIRTAAEVQSLVSRISFTGGTPLGEKLDARVLRPMVVDAIGRRTLRKPVAVFIITDGEPASKPAVRSAVSRAAATCASAGVPGAVAFQFCQVGKDARAQAYLGELDNDPEVGRYVDAISYYESECEEFARKGVTLTPELYLLKLMLGAVDRSYDEQD